MKFPSRPLVSSLLLIVAGIFLFGRVQADGGKYFPPVADKITLDECSSCHLAFPPSMLPAASWQKMMSSLDNHFGENASLDPKTTELITRYLVSNAGDAGSRYSKLLKGVGPGEAPQRITELPKWVREHREVSKREWARKEVGSKANCAACHKGAERGYFEED